MNEYGFDFDFEVDNESTMMGKGMWLLINVFALTFSAMTTGAFFYAYVGDAFAFLFGEWSPYVTAFAGMTALDGLSRAWAHVRGHWSDTTDQMAVARFMSWADLVASVIVTVVYLLLNAAFDVGIYNPIVVQTIADAEVVTGGDLTTLGLILNVVGVIILVAAIAGNFVAAHLFSDTSSENREAVHKAEMGAMAATTRHRISKQQAVMTANHTMNEIMSVLPEHTRTKGADNMERYINSKFGDGASSAANAGTPPSTSPLAQDVEYFSVNGKPSIAGRLFGKGKKNKGGDGNRKTNTPSPHPTAKPSAQPSAQPVDETIAFDFDKERDYPSYIVERFKNNAWQVCEGYTDFESAWWHIASWTRSKKPGDLSYRIMHEGRQIYHSKHKNTPPPYDRHDAYLTKEKEESDEKARQDESRAIQMEQESAASGATTGDTDIPNVTSSLAKRGSYSNGNGSHSPNG